MRNSNKIRRGDRWPVKIGTGEDENQVSYNNNNYYAIMALLCGSVWTTRVDLLGHIK